MIARRALLVLAATAAFALAAAAEAPVLAAAPKKARERIVAAARSYEGVPYLFGGSDGSGFDCSGLVYRVYLQTLGVVLPRTAAGQYSYAEAIPRDSLQPGDLLFFDTTGPKAHVGIYEGEGRFIHAASEGADTGVVSDALAESYWSRTFAGAGRMIPPAEYLGLSLSASLGASLGAQDVLRGLRGSVGASYRILGIEAGLELRPEYDATLGVVRLPAVLALSLDRRLKLFAGPALTLGSPGLGARAYQASGGLLATAGIEFTPVRFRVGSLSLGLTGELVYNRYVAAGAADAAADSIARVRAGLGLSLLGGI